MSSDAHTHGPRARVLSFTSPNDPVLVRAALLDNVLARQQAMAVLSQELARLLFECDLIVEGLRLALVAAGDGAASLAEAAKYDIAASPRNQRS